MQWFLDEANCGYVMNNYRLHCSIVMDRDFQQVCMFCLSDSLLPIILSHAVTAQQERPQQEEATHLPHSRLQQGLRQDVPFARPPALAHGREAVRLLLVLLWQALHPLGWAAAAQAHPHRWDLPDVKKLHPYNRVMEKVKVFKWSILPLKHSVHSEGLNYRSV